MRRGAVVVVDTAVVVVAGAATRTGAPSPRVAARIEAPLAIAIADAAASTTAKRWPPTNPNARSLIVTCWLETQLGQHLLDVRVDRRSRLDLGDRAVRILEPVARDRAHHHFVAFDQ